MEKQNDKEKRIASFLFELGTMRKLPRMHRQLLFTEDSSDTIATHSYRVTMIGWFLAKLENADPYKVMLMCMTHDMGEIRTGDHNWVHKKYLKVFDDEIRKEQLGTLPFDDLEKISEEYDERKSKEAVIAKDADLLDQILLLKEYSWQGSSEAKLWLTGKESAPEVGSVGNRQYQTLKTESAKHLARLVIDGAISDWWNTLWRDARRK